MIGVVEQQEEGILDQNVVSGSALVDPTFITSEDLAAAEEFQKEYVSHVPMPILASFNAILRVEQFKESLHKYSSCLVCNYLYDQKLCRTLLDFDKEIKHLEITLIAVFSLRRKDFICPDIQFENHYELYLNYSQRKKHRITAKDSAAQIECKRKYRDYSLIGINFVKRVRAYFKKHFLTTISTDCNIFNNSQANDHDPVVVDDINGAVAFSNPIGIDGLQIGAEQQSSQALEDWDALSTFDLEIHDDQDGGTLNTRELRKRKQSGDQSDTIESRNGKQSTTARYPKPKNKKRKHRRIKYNQSITASGPKFKQFVVRRVKNYDNRNMVELIKHGYGNLNMDQKQDILKFVMDDFELCENCFANCSSSVFEKEGDPIYCEKENCNCAVYSRSKFQKNGFFIGSLPANLVDLQYKPIFAEPILRKRRRGQLILRNLRPVNFGRMKKQQNRYMLPWYLIPDVRDRNYVGKVLDVMEDEVSEFREQNKKLFGPIIQRDSDGSLTRDAVVLVSLPGNEVQSYHTDQKSHKDGLSLIYALQDDTYLDVICGSHTSEARQEVSVPNTRVHIPQNHYILFSGGLRHRGIDYEKFNVRIHMYIDFIGSHRTPGLVFNLEESN